MKRKLDDEYEVFHSENIDEIKVNIDLPYHFSNNVLKLLKDENKFPQEYYYIKKNEDFAFFVLYKNKMNIFTFGKLKCFVNLNVIGYPCSLSCPGYITNNEKMFLDYIKTFKGAKLVLNVTDPITYEGITIGETLPTCIISSSYNTIKEYMESLRSSYRRRINIAIKKCEDINIKIETNKTSETDIYDLYLNTYNKSDYKLEKLDKGFFEKVDATKMIFLKEDKPIGFVLVKLINNELIFMLCGMDYTYETADLYYYMLYKIVEFAIDNNCSKIDLGQTSEETKMKFGAMLEKRYFYAHHSNNIINFLVKHGKALLEYKYDFPKFRVFKEEKQ